MESQGLGDTVEKITAATGIKKVVEIFQKLQERIVDAVEEKLH